MQGRLQQAVVKYAKWLSATLNDPRTILNYAAALQQAGNLSQAELDHRRVMELLLRASAAYVHLESLYIEEGRCDAAIAMYKQAIAVNPSDASAYFDLWVMFQHLGQDHETRAF